MQRTFNNQNEDPDYFDINSLSKKINRSVGAIRQYLMKKDWNRVPPPIKDGPGKNSSIQWSETVYKAWKQKRDHEAMTKLLNYNELSSKGRPRNQI